MLSQGKPHNYIYTKLAFKQLKPVSVYAVSKCVMRAQLIQPCLICCLMFYCRSPSTGVMRYCQHAAYLNRGPTVVLTQEGFDIFYEQHKFQDDWNNRGTRDQPSNPSYDVAIRKTSTNIICVLWVIGALHWEQMSENRHVGWIEVTLHRLILCIILLYIDLWLPG